MEYWCVKCVAFVGTRSRNAPGPSVRLVGNRYPIPFMRQVLVGSAASNSGTALLLMFFNSTNSNWGAGRGSDLTGKLLFACADNVTAKCFAIDRRIETETMSIARQVRARVARVKKNIIAMRIKRKAAVGPRRGIEMRFIEHLVAERIDKCSRRNSKFLRHSGISAEEPAADVHDVRCRIVKLDEVNTRFGVSQYFVDEH